MPSVVDLEMSYNYVNFTFFTMDRIFIRFLSLVDSRWNCKM